MARLPVSLPKKGVAPAAAPALVLKPSPSMPGLSMPPKPGTQAPAEPRPTDPRLLKALAIIEDPASTQLDWIGFDEHEDPAIRNDPAIQRAIARRFLADREVDAGTKEGMHAAFLFAIQGGAPKSLGFLLTEMKNAEYAEWKDSEKAFADWEAGRIRAIDVIPRLTVRRADYVRESLLRDYWIGTPEERKALLDAAAREAGRTKRLLPTEAEFHAFDASEDAFVAWSRGTAKAGDIAHLLTPRRCDTLMRALLADIGMDNASARIDALVELEIDGSRQGAFAELKGRADEIRNALPPGDAILCRTRLAERIARS
ncbi:hypothetical protein WV31_10485 [Magnetospirillum sp. ME-1]|uniref:hypothetical protein n=1 Tax=Magnetospirillum sp. ME-1 TaxID=1639348 RepID=UPI000A179AC9|nr:hypothetical protein [Magnetospirillum sp. ME-1]ARJ66054.1 hypothetical protein WV31_10485 [Magnetospirillum sp. ME-1]